MLSSAVLANVRGCGIDCPAVYLGEKYLKSLNQVRLLKPCVRDALKPQPTLNVNINITIRWLTSLLWTYLMFNPKFAA